MFMFVFLIAIVVMCIIISLYFNNHTDENSKIVYREINECITEWINEYNHGFYRI